MSRLAREIMETQILTVSPDSPLADVQRLFVEEEIHGAPVVDDTGAIVGVISSADVLRAVSERHAPDGMTAAYLQEMVEFSSSDPWRVPDDLAERLSGQSASDYMTLDPVCVAPDTTIQEVARTLSRDRIHRVLVVDGEHLVGLISTFDLVRLLEKEE